MKQKSKSKLTPEALEQLLREGRFSKERKLWIADRIGADEGLYRHLWRQVQKGSDQYSRLAVWVLEACSLKHPFLIDSILGEIVDFLPRPNHNGIHRGLTKILAELESIDEPYQGVLYSLCIDWILSPQKHVAIKVHCMTIAMTIAMPEPVLREELSMAINDQIPYNSVAFAARARKILKRLN